MGDGDNSSVGMVGELMSTDHYEKQFKLALKVVEGVCLNESSLIRIAQDHMAVRFPTISGSKANLSIGSTILVGPSHERDGSLLFSGKVTDLNVMGSDFWKAKVSYEGVYMVAGQWKGLLVFKGGRLTGEEFPDFSDKATVVQKIEDIDLDELPSELKDGMKEPFIAFCDKYRAKR